MSAIMSTRPPATRCSRRADGEAKQEEVLALDTGVWIGVSG